MKEIGRKREKIGIDGEDLGDFLFLMFNGIEVSILFFYCEKRGSQFPCCCF